jgi:hypothetical protein
MASEEPSMLPTQGPTGRPAEGRSKLP